ncbi:MAG: hypothetical protein QM658_03350 [Gordonia sp. (in: high G+C Gram-positive bacteria)]
MPDKKKVPLIALDVDGVLRPIDPDEKLLADDPGWERFEVEVTPENWPERRYLVSPPPHPATLPLILNPSLHGTWINDLIERGVEVGWATTWESTANTFLPPLLGIPELPMAISHEQGDQGRFSETADSWKARSLAERYIGRPVCWIDDWSAPWKRSWHGRRRDETLVITPHEKVGLTAAQMSEVDEWVARFL